MVMNKSKGNMYGFVTHTWNPIGGKCPHDCKYCYMKGFKVGELRLDEKALKDDLGSGNFIFVGSSTDMWAYGIPTERIKEVLNYCKKFDNTYLVQSKNPHRFLDFVLPDYPDKIIFGATIETNRNTSYLNQAPPPEKRYNLMGNLSWRKMISIEPIMDFDLNIFVNWIKGIQPEFVSIGADSKGHKLPEPSKEKINALIKELKKFTEVKLKDNLKRLMS